MHIEELERRYQILVNDLRAGRMDEMAFTLALDNLHFRDERGRYWMIGSQTGAWYCYDGQNWRQANPRATALPPAESLPLPLGTPERRQENPGETSLPTPELTQVYEVRPALHSQSTFALGPVLVLILALLILPFLILPVAGAPPMDGPALAPSPRPPIGGVKDESDGGGGGGSGNGGGGDHGSPGPQGAISGVVTDLSLKQPGAGIEVSVNGAIVRTDKDGSYSITGLHPGTYTVSPELQGQGTPAQAPILVNLNEQDRAIINLAYFSQSQPTAAPQAAASNAPLPTPPPAATPPALPLAGAPSVPQHQPLLMIGLGLVLMVVGSLLLKTHR